MARGINKVIIVGNLGREPETRFTPDGLAVTTLAIATSEGWKDKQTGQMQERTEWHRVVMYSRLAEIASEYLKKGSKVYIEGRLRTNKWQDKSGNDRYTTEIIAGEMQMLDSRGAGTGSGSYTPKQQSSSPSSPASSQQQPAMATDNFDDDIPF